LGLKTFLKVFFVVVVCALVSHFIGGCMEFRMSSRAMDDYYEGYKKPELVSFSFEDRTVNYAEAGDRTKPLVMFVHGSPGSWSAFADFLRDSVLITNFHMIAPDRPGFGYSNFGKAEPSLKKQSEFLYQILKRYPEKKAILVGHSLGGPVIAQMAMDYPESVKGLLFVAPSIDPALEPDEWFRPLLRNFVIRTFTPISLAVSNEEIIDLKEELEMMVDGWRSLHTPVYMLQGDEDTLVPMENAYYPGRFMPDSLIHIQLLDGVNHFIPWSHPQEIVKGIYYLNALP
jgi:pimeloyl-ACP methyl ester carboxylesterase